MESMVFGLSIVYMSVWAILMWMLGISLHTVVRIKLPYKCGGLFDKGSCVLLMTWFLISALPLIAGLLLAYENTSGSGVFNAEFMQVMNLAADPVFLGSTAAFMILSGVCLHLIDHHPINYSLGIRN